jgi:hypothetical protein
LVSEKATQQPWLFHSLFVEKIYDILENRKFAIATFLDLSKAFDLVNHN